MMMRHHITILLTLLTLTLTAHGQTAGTVEDGTSPTFLPTMRVGKVMLDGDSVQYVEMNRVYCYPPKTFTSAKERMKYNRLVRDVKRVLPIAKEVRMIMMETYEYLQTLPTKRERDEHLKLVEKSIIKDYKPKMKKLTYSQGKLLIKLVYRECDSSSYDIVKAILGPVRAGFWQAFAWCFGANLKKGYDPEGTDRLTERVVLMVEAGQL